MNSKMIKELGVEKTKDWFRSLGISIFKPIGYNPKVDLVAEFNGKAQRIRVKAAKTAKNGKVRFDLNSSGRRMGVDVDTSGFDYYALYSIDRNKLYLLKSTEAPKVEVTIRFEDGKRNSKRIKKESIFEVESVVSPSI